MLFYWTFAVYLISHEYIINAIFDEKSGRYFVNKEIFDETRKRDKFQRLKFFNDLQCESSQLDQNLKRIGGPDACQVKPHSKPWAVKIPRCGGTLISKRVVLTAAHCICNSDQPAGNCNRSVGLDVTVGEHNIYKTEDGEQVIKIESTKAHKDYNGNSTYGYDVALIFLKEDALLNDNVQLASLPRSNQDCPPGNSLTLSGWGRDPNRPNRPPHNILWAVKQECLDVGKCGRFGSLTDKNIILCVGDKADPRNGGFKGDSGGPLTFSDDFGERTIFGVVSGRGNTRLQPMKTGAFTRVSHPKILDWIKNTMNSYLK